MTDTIDVHFNRMGRGRDTLVVVAIGTDAYGARHIEPLQALHAAAAKAVEGLALRGRSVNANDIVRHGLKSLPPGA